MEEQQKILEGLVSVVMITHRSDNPDRREITRQSIESLYDTVDNENEIIVLNNEDDTLGRARNIAIKATQGEYLVICDDDILFKPGWLEECIKLVNMGEKFMATPVHQIRIKRWELEPVNGFRCNYRTGSNCMVMKRSTFNDVGWFGEKLGFDNVGKRYANTIVRKGYSFLITKEPMAIDLGFKKHSYATTR